MGAADESNNQDESKKGGGKKKGQPLDLNKLDQKSIEIMVLLMLHLINMDMTT